MKDVEHELQLIIRLRMNTHHPRMNTRHLRMKTQDHV